MTKTKGFLLAAAVAAMALFTLSCSDDDKDDGGGVSSLTLDGTWISAANNRIKIDGNNWEFSQGSTQIAKDTWSSNSTISAPSMGKITLTITQPSVDESVKTNTFNYALDGTGKMLMLSEPVLTTPNVWDTVAGGYQKL